MRKLNSDVTNKPELDLVKDDHNATYHASVELTYTNIIKPLRHHWGQQSEPWGTKTSVIPNYVQNFNDEEYDVKNYDIKYYNAKYVE